MSIPDHPGEPVPEKPLMEPTDPHGKPREASGLRMLNPLEGVSASGAVKHATKIVQKQAQDRVNGFVRGLLVDHHNLKMRAARLIQESETAKSQMKAIEEKLGRINAGDLSDMEPFEFKESDK